MEFKYTLAFLKRGDELLMLNRNFEPWMGSWNGVGGKRIGDETSLDTIIREIKEETDITVTSDQITDKGVVTWNSYDENGYGLHVFLVTLDDDFLYETPKVTVEGILDWKKLSWVANFENYGIADNIPYFINYVVYDDKRFNHKCTFENKILLKVENLAL